VARVGLFGFPSLPSVKYLPLFYKLNRLSDGALGGGRADPYRLKGILTKGNEGNKELRMVKRGTCRRVWFSFVTFVAFC
jgi:hypothetical protein